MEDLRQTALAYYMAAPTEIQHLVKEVFNGMDPNDNGYVMFKEFSEYMEIMGRKDMASDEFFEELKHPGNEVLHLDDIVTLCYIIHSGRPICGGVCKKFVKGMYFTCVKCFFDDKNKDEFSAFSVCPQCFSAGKYEHCHNDFLDPIVLLQFKRLEGLNKERGTSTDAAGKREARHSRASTPSENKTKKPKYERSTSSAATVLVDPSASRTSTAAASRTEKPGMSSSRAIVPAVTRRSKQDKMQTAIQFGQLLASVGSIVVASSCTIL